MVSTKVNKSCVLNMMRKAKFTTVKSARSALSKAFKWCKAKGTYKRTRRRFKRRR